jgi:integrase
VKNELEYQKFKGLIVFCNKCKTNIHNNKKGNACKHPINRQVYKAIVRTGSGYDRKTKILKSRDFDKAIKEFLDFKEQVLSPALYQQSNKKPKSPYLKNTLAMYIDYMQDVDVPHHLKKHISKSHIKLVITSLKYFVNFLVTNGANLNTYKLSSINDSIVGMYCDYLEKKNGSNYTYNGKIKVMRTFFNYLIDKEDYLLKNVWKKVKLKSEKPTDISISDKDFYELLSVISPDDAMAQIGKTRRNMYRPWLKDLIKLKAYTGRRNAELFAMTWNMIHYENDMPIYIESPNIKVNRQQNNFDEKDFQYAYVPVGEELFELLIDLNLENNQDSNEYIIAPEVENRENLEKYASIYFTFFFKKLKRDYTRQLKHLRQTYITREDLFVNGRISMQHSNYRTTAKHYIDKREIAKQMVKNGFRIFSEKNQKGTPVGHSSQKKILKKSVTI